MGSPLCATWVCAGGNIARPIIRMGGYRVSFQRRLWIAVNLSRCFPELEQAQQELIDAPLSWHAVRRFLSGTVDHDPLHMNVRLTGTMVGCLKPCSDPIFSLKSAPESCSRMHPRSRSAPLSVSKHRLPVCRARSMQLFHDRRSDERGSSSNGSSFSQNRQPYSNKAPGSSVKSLRGTATAPGSRGRSARRY